MADHSLDRPPPYTREQCAKLSAFIAVPVLLFCIDLVSRLSHLTETEFLLVPPLAVVIYLIFSRPDAPNANFRSIVVTPILGAVVGQISYQLFGLTPWGVAIATLAVLVLQAAIRANMPPALALAVLAMLLKAQGPAYSIGVALAAMLVWLIFILWRRYVWMPRPQAAPKSGGNLPLE